MSFAYWIAETNEFGPKSLSELGLVPKHRSVHDIIADIKREQGSADTFGRVSIIINFKKESA